MSGGLDSTMLALWWLNKGKTVKAYAFDYGQKHDVELKKLKKNIAFLQSKNLPIELQVINLKDCFSDSTSSLRGNGEIPKENYDKDSMKSTVVENRNVIFSSIIYGKALSWAKRENENVIISLGIHGGDHSLYPDTTQESRDALEKAFQVSNWGSERIHYFAPFISLPKSEVLREGIYAMSDLGFKKSEVNKVLKNTHSCYDPNEKGDSCGECGTCKERIDAFKKLSWKDPIKYIDKN